MRFLIRQIMFCIIIGMIVLTLSSGGIASTPLMPDPKPKVCGMLGASFDDSDNLGYKAPPDFLGYNYEFDLETSIRIAREPRLLPFLETLGMVNQNGAWRSPNKRIRYVSTAWGGAQADLHYWGQLEALDRRIHMPELDCLIIGMSGSFFYRPQASIDAIKNIHTWIKTNIPSSKLILIQYPSIMPEINVSWDFFNSSRINWSSYPDYRKSFDSQLCGLSDTFCVNAWEGFKGGIDGWHPNWLSCQVAAYRVDQVIRKVLKACDKVCQN